MKLILIRGALLTLCAVLVGGCVSAPTIDVRHDPVYRAEAHTAHIEVMATSERGIDHIDVMLFTGPLLACERDHLPSLFPCRDSAQIEVFTCAFSPRAQPPAPPTPGRSARVGPPLPKSAHCPVTHDLETLSLISYRATAVDGAGKTAATPYITFSGGAAPSEAVAMHGPGPGGHGPSGPTGVIGGLDLIDTVAPPPRGPFASDVLRPMWLVADDVPWSTDIVLNLRQRIDVGFLPDPDWESYRAFSDATGRFVGRLLFVDPYGYNADQYVRLYRTGRNVFSYWVGPDGGSTFERDCRTKFTGWADAMRAVTDGQAVVHQTFFRDCGHFGPGASATVSGTASEAAYIFVHESGHFLHCLGDEYPEDGLGHYSCSDPPNTFPTQQQCEQTATQRGYPTSWCILIGDDSGWWRISENPLVYDDIMDGCGEVFDEFLKTDWYDTSRDAVLKRMAACLQGACW
jgi:hypothetical protein